MSKKIGETIDKVVVAVDARNHGESPHHDSHTYIELASDVSNLMNTLNIKQADIIGHSMGGRTGMVLALTEPTKVSSLVVVDISPVSTAGALNDFIPNLLNAMKTVSFEGISNLNSAKTHVKDKLLESKAIDLDSIGFVLMNVGVKPDKSVGWLCNVNVLSKHFMDIATFPDLSGKVYDGPTLFVGGGESPYIPPSDIDGIKKLFPKAELKYVEDAGHNVHAESPSEFQQIVTHFLLRNKK
ncbi:sn-1-specific diacylglycerol lipase ABHD11-like [Battus philenor]|uniref:sn-1-specific diacylglycerol lipase ABHD11-like n=1 Tax=Battus philenor TaxID=42288 RepID=UPI0035D062ED